MKVAEIKELTVKELEARKREIRHEIFNLRVQQQGAQLEKPHMLRTLRRDVARLETVLAVKRQSGAAAQAAPAAPTAAPAAKAPKAARKPTAKKAQP